MPIAERPPRVSEVQIVPAFDRGSKQSKLSGDLQHLQAYYGSRINEDPLEITKTTFSNGQTLDAEGLVTPHNMTAQREIPDEDPPSYHMLMRARETH